MESLSCEDVWGLCFNIYKAHGRKLSLPPNTDHKKTYQWQYITGLTHKFKEWEFDRVMAERFLQIVVQYASDHNLLHKGMALHFQHNLLNLCLKQLNAELETITSDVYELRKSQQWVASLPIPLEPLMLKRENYGGHTNIVKWYIAGKITELYLALSKVATRVMGVLPIDERLFLPNAASLWLIRNDFLRPETNQAHALSILQKDLKNVKHAGI